MRNIGIVGAGVAGLELALYLQGHGIDTTLYTDRGPDQIREGRLPSLVVRFDPTRQRERALGVDHWSYADYGAFGIRMFIGSEPPLVWKGSFRAPASGVDMRIYQSTLLLDFAARGGAVEIGALGARDVTRLAARHDLTVVCAGRSDLAQLFPRDPARSPYAEPQRWLTGAFFRGLELPESLRVNYTASPGNGEIFQSPFTSFDGHVSCILVEAIPGGGFDELTHRRYEDDPERFEATLLELLRRHAPLIYEHASPKEFAVTRPLDVLQGAITPTVRHGYRALDDGKHALALGDMHIINDPIVAQGANMASRCARLLGDLLIQDGPIDADFCRAAEAQLWQASRAATEWTNAMLQPPPPHALQVFAAAAESREVADELCDNFGYPEQNWEIFGSPAGAAAFLGRHGLSLTPR